MSIPPNVKVPHNWLAGVHTEYLTKLDDGGRYLAVLRGHTPSDLDVVFIVKYDHVHNRFYFVNAMTRDKTWELPDIIGQRQQQQHREQLGEMMKKQQQQQHYYSSPDYLATSPPTFLPQPTSSSAFVNDYHPQGLSRLPNEIGSSAFNNRNNNMNNNNNTLQRQSLSPRVVVSSTSSHNQHKDQDQRESANNSPMSASGFDENDILDVPLLKHELTRLTESMKDRDVLITQFQSSFANHQKEIRALTFEVQRLRKIGVSPSPARDNNAERNSQVTPVKVVNSNNNHEDNHADGGSDLDVAALKREVASLRHALEKKQERESVRSPTNVSTNNNNNEAVQQQHNIQNAHIISALSTEVNDEKRRNADQQDLIQNLRKKIDDESKKYFQLDQEFNQRKNDHHREVDALKKALEKEQEKCLMISTNNTNTTNSQSQQQQDLENQLVKLRTQLSSIEAALSHAEVSNLVQERSASAASNSNVTPIPSNSGFISSNNNNNNSTNSAASSPSSSPTVAILRFPDSTSEANAKNPDENSVNLIHLLVQEVTKLRSENRKWKKDFDSMLKIEVTSADQNQNSTKSIDGNKDDIVTFSVDQVMSRDYSMFSDFELDDRRRIEEEESAAFPTLRILFKVITSLFKSSEQIQLSSLPENKKSSSKNKKEENSSDDELHEQMSLGFSPTAEKRKLQQQAEQAPSKESANVNNNNNANAISPFEKEYILSRERQLFSDFESDDRKRVEDEEISDFPTLRMLFKAISSQMMFQANFANTLGKGAATATAAAEVSSDDELHEQMSMGFANKKNSSKLDNRLSSSSPQNMTLFAIESLFKFHEILATVGFAEKQQLLDRSEIIIRSRNKNKNDNIHLLATSSLQTHFGMMEILAGAFHVEKNLELLAVGRSEKQQQKQKIKV